MSDPVSKSNPDGHSTAVTMNVLMEDLGELKHRSSTTAASSDSVAMTKDELVLAGFGKKQQLQRRFRYLSAIGLTCGMLLSWPAILNAIQIGLANGGSAGFIWGLVGSIVGALLQALVMGEMASMIPLAGGAFNWISVLAPPRQRRFLSYVAGWLNVIFYQCFVLSSCYGSASAIQGLAVINYPGYDAKLWQATLISYSVALFGLFINTYLGRFLPQVETFLLAFFVLGYFAILIPIVCLGKPRSASDVFGTFLSVNGWPDNGVAFLVGWVASYGSFTGIDAADHIAEEIESAPKVIPFTMWFATLLNGVLAFGMVVAVMFVTLDYVAAAHPTASFAFIDIFLNVTGSPSGAAALVSIPVVANTLSVSSVIATASRSLWSFAREKGLPFSDWLVKIDPKTRLPYHAIFVTVVVELILGLVSIGSSTAFDAFYSVVTSAYYSTFLVAASVMLHKRLTTPSSQIPWGPFRLERWGVPITVVALLYTFVTFIFSFFPPELPVTASNMNYSVLIYGAGALMMLGFWVLHGHKVYGGPVWEFEGDFIRKN